MVFALAGDSTMTSFLGISGEHVSAEVKRRRENVTGSPHGDTGDRAMPTPFYNFVAVVSWPVLHGLFRLDAQGLDNLPAEGGFVLAANHTSNFDPWPLGMPLWPKRQLLFMAKAELFNPILGPPLRSGGAFPVRRGEADMEAVQAAVELCRAGGVVAMFPEGTRQRKGLRKKFEHKPRPGSARIALTAGVPLVPAAIKGMDRLSRLPQLRVGFGEPVPVDDLEGKPPRQAYQVATERLMERVYALYEGL
jgi:1-acyl-sn-glycerol-3-phosphate acyltransferase